jgi:hypothetical protein
MVQDPLAAPLMHAHNPPAPGASTRPKHGSPADQALAGSRSGRGSAPNRVKPTRWEATGSVREDPMSTRLDQRGWTAA